MAYLVDEDPITSALMSPGMAMASQAAQNLTNMRMGGQIRSPIDAYQQAVFNRARLDQERQSLLQQQKIREMQQGPNIGTYNPRDYTPDSWALFVETKDPGVLERYNPFSQGNIRYDSQGNPIVGVDTAAENAALQAGAIAGAQEDRKSWADTDQKFAAEFPGQFQQLQGQRDLLQRTLDVVENPDNYDSQGPIMGRIAAFYDPETAQINAAGIQQTIETLSDVTTGALSERELSLFESLSAKGTRTPAQNARLLKQSIDAVERRLEQLREKGTYYRDKGTLEGYGFDSLLSEPEAVVDFNDL